MSRFRLFCFKQFCKVHVFCLLMMLVFRIFMNVNLGFILWIVAIISTLCIGIYLFYKPYMIKKPYMITKDIYAIMAISSCLCLSFIAQRFLFIALGIDLTNMVHFFLLMLIFAGIVAGSMKLIGWRKKHGFRYQISFVKLMRYLGWGFLVFLFFYQLILSYLLRPNFLTVLALSISHGNLLLIIWTYFDVKQLYQKRRRFYGLPTPHYANTIPHNYHQYRATPHGFPAQLSLPYQPPKSNQHL